jgi:quercetin dioxygenase-like cupin family protein
MDPKGAKRPCSDDLEARMFAKRNPDGYRSLLPGIRVKTLCFGDKTLMTEFQFDAGSDLPEHSHPHEQTGYLLSGKVVFTCGGEDHVVLPGDSWCVSGDVTHSAHYVEDSVAVEVFSPVREDFLPDGPPAK